MKHKLLFAVFFGVMACSIPALASASTCLNIPFDLSQGMTDATSGGQITPLQNYLAAAGYLGATPNGVFGPATLAAVKAFQLTNGISTTGTVGPLTRVALYLKSCAVSTVSTAAAPAQSPSTPPPAPAIPSITVTAPGTGESLSLGDTYTVKWTGPLNGTTYNVILEDASGTPQGFIVAGSYANQYTWQVGTINNTNNTSLETVPPGNYQIHVENASIGAQSSDVPSGVFTLGATVNISQIFPTTAPADGDTTIVLYGSGFNSTSLVDIYGYGTFAPLYESPDGRVIAFTVPAGTYPGVHTVSVLNSYGGASNITVESNTTNLTVVRQ